MNRQILALMRGSRPRPYATRLTAPIRSISSARKTPPVIQINKGTFYRNYPSPGLSQAENPPYFPDLTWSLPSEKPQQQNSAADSTEAASQLQHWAVIGSSGKAKFLEILRGQHICIPPHARSFPYLASDDIKDARLRYPARAIQYVGFNGEQGQGGGGIRGAYMSARYESLREDTDFTVQQYLEGKTELNPLEDKNMSKEDQALLDEVTTDLKLKELLSMPVANLSNGQTRRARIAKALLSRPEVLLLDEPFMGLDPPTVQLLSPLLYNLAAKSSPRLVISLRPQDRIPDWINHLVILGPNNTVALQGQKKDVLGTLHLWKTIASHKPQEEKLAIRNSLGEQGQAEYDHAAQLYKDGKFTGKMSILNDMGLMARDEKIAIKGRKAQGEPIISMDGVHVQYGDKVVLGNWEQVVDGQQKKGLHWKVHRGERWGVFGLNGSGKTTLVALITSDHPQTYSLPLKLFGRSRLPEPGKPGFSIFDLQKRIGHSSPEVHAFFPRHLSLYRSIASAFADTFLVKPKLDDYKRADVAACLRFFEADLNPNFNGDFSSSHDVSWAESITFGSLSIAQQRLVLLMRSIVHRPDLIVLDESFGGMSPSLRDKCLHFLEVGQLHSSSTGSRRTLDFARVWNLPPEPATEQEVRFRGLTHEQALVVISHVKEEVPDIVSRWMLLPSPSAEAEAGTVKQKDEQGRLIFRTGELTDTETVAGDGWDRIWGFGV